jgi:hypothetical protein
MVRAQRPLSQLERLLVQRRREVVSTLVAMEASKAVHNRAHFRVRRAQIRPQRGQRLLVQRLGLPVLALIACDHSKVSQ